MVGIQNCGIVGFGQMRVHISETGKEKVLNFHSETGSKATPKMWKGIVMLPNLEIRQHDILKDELEKGQYDQLSSSCEDHIR